MDEWMDGKRDEQRKRMNGVRDGRENRCNRVHHENERRWLHRCLEGLKYQ